MSGKGKRPATVDASRISADLMLMPLQMLQQRFEMLEVQRRSIGTWSSIAKTDSGKKVLKQLKEELAQIRETYRHIPAHHEAAMTLLSGFQGEERRVELMILRIEDAEKFEKSIDTESNAVLALITEREKAIAERRPEIISSEAKESSDART